MTVHSGLSRLRLAALPLIVLAAGLAIPAGPAQAAEPRVAKVLGYSNRWAQSDSEIRADFVLAVAKGEKPTSVRYSFNSDGRFDTEARLATQPGADNQYQIVSTTPRGDTDLLTITLRGGLGPGTGCAASPKTYQLGVQVTMPSGTVTLPSLPSWAFADDSCPGERPAARLPYDNAWSSPDGNSQDGYGHITSTGKIPANTFVVDAVNPNFGNQADCGVTDRAYYQLVRDDGRPSSATPAPVSVTLDPHGRDDRTKAVELPALDLTGSGPGYYRFLVWPQARSSVGVTDCSARSWNPATEDGFQVGSVFYDYDPSLLLGGKVVAWGNSAHGQNDVPPLTDVVAVADGGSHSLALRLGGTVASWGDANAKPPAGLTGVRAISASWCRHSLAVKWDGTVVAWGGNACNGMDVPAGLTGVKAVSAGYHVNLALKKDGTVVAWGRAGCPALTVPAGLTNVVAVAAGNDFAVALKGDGTVVAWGDNSLHQTEVPAGLSGVVAVEAGAVNGAALMPDGTAVGWGDNTAGQLDATRGVTDLRQVALGALSVYGLKNDGTVVAWSPYCGADATQPPAGLRNVQRIAAGDCHALALVTGDSQ
ncbi:RCC1 domain-containing protein [Longispora albida]|uniref:RCC1 domain-containing protein n=1 Tax=Longispora albida TaxID=203523 RepID=UPI0003744ABB|nr:hypothetical protein [Longispora albida]